MTNGVEVYFALKGDEFDPDEFTALSGLIPSQVFRKGGAGQHIDEYKFGMWKISTGRSANDVLLIDEIADQLIERIESGADCIAEAVAKSGLYAVLEIVLYVSMDETLSTPSLGFTSRTISFLHKVGATIDVDIYRN